ncbi:Putative tetratricopeptide-like helical domain superfamily [Septoria linicola]|uniref:Tetratricopeptide-like helical domain superfamily n=1 Tax=Septoria linicola TaxID=215465 RepID=A0A9Q9AK37_9PEZI|nr:Putative tetratricopeptide-like helical domain superfamily [Septoria linicola]
MCNVLGELDEVVQARCIGQSGSGLENSMDRCKRLLDQIDRSLPDIIEQAGRGLKLVDHEAEAKYVLSQLRALYMTLTPAEGRTHAGEPVGRLVTTSFILDDRWPPGKDSAISSMPDSESPRDERHSDLYTSSPTNGREASDEKEVYFQRPCRSNSSASIGSDISWCTALCGPETPRFRSETLDRVAHLVEPDTLCDRSAQLCSDEILADSISLRIGLHVLSHSGSDIVFASTPGARTNDDGCASGVKKEALSLRYAVTKHGDLRERTTATGKPALPRRPPPPVPRSAKHDSRGMHSAVTTSPARLAHEGDEKRPRVQALEQRISNGPCDVSSIIQRSSSLPPQSLRPGKRPTRAGSKDKIDLASISLLAEHRVQAIIHSWNRRHWDEAELLLQEHLKICAVMKDQDLAGRVQHLLAVCASFRGEWQEAMARFIANFRKPLNSSEDIDTGVCAAAYWLGDLYAMQNRTTDALLAYAIAGYNPLADASQATTSQEAIRAERATMRLGVSQAALNQQWQDNDTRREWSTDRSQPRDRQRGSCAGIPGSPSQNDAQRSLQPGTGKSHVSNGLCCRRRWSVRNSTFATTGAHAVV